MPGLFGLSTQQKLAQYITNINQNKFPNQDVNAAIASIKANRAVQFVDWCPTGFKVQTFQKIQTFIRRCEISKDMIVFFFRKFHSDFPLKG